MTLSDLRKKLEPDNILLTLGDGNSDSASYQPVLLVALEAVEFVMIN